MKTVKKVAANFKKMDAAQMKKIKGGYWLEHTDSTGKVTRIWVQSIKRHSQKRVIVKYNF